MKSLLSLILFAVLSVSAFADDTIHFVGKITAASQRYPQAIGRECSIDLTPAHEGLPMKQFDVVLKVAGMKKKKDAPLKKMFLYYGQNHVYVAGGGKYRGEAAQNLTVTLDASETKVLKWTYVDGTEDWFMTYICE
jgi:hypothetical protein